MISIICVYNERRVLENYLLTGLQIQNGDYELILIDNCRNAFQSAAEALNNGARRAVGSYFMFAHQDVRLCGTDWLTNAEAMLATVPTLGIAGIAGMSEHGSTNLERQRNVLLEHERPVTRWGNPISQPEAVQTLDECLVIIPKEVFTIHPFDELTCLGWHHYALDYSLTIRGYGFSVAVLPLPAHHRSLGFSMKLTPRIRSIREIRRYYESLDRIVAKHRATYEWIYTTNGAYCTSRSLVYQDLRRLPSLIARQLSSRWARQ